MSAENLCDHPDEHDLLGFPGVKAEHPKVYLRRLWLPAENDRITYPKFHDTKISDMASLASKVVNGLAKDTAKLKEQLQGCAFLKAEANWILEERGYGRCVWGEDCGANIRLKSNLEGTYPRWRATTASGERVENDQEMIKLTFRYWMAARLQKKIIAPSRETQGPVETNESRQDEPGSHQGAGAQDVLSCYKSSPLHPPDGGAAVAVVEASHYTCNDQLGCDMASNSSEQKPWILDTVPSQDNDSLKRKRSNASEKIDVERRLQPLESTAAARPGSPGLIDPAVARTQPVMIEASPTYTSPLLACPAASASPRCTAVVRKVEHEARPDNHRNFSECEVPATNLEAQQRLQNLLTDARMNLEVMSDEILLVARWLYRESPHRHPDDDWYNDFRVLSQAMDRWEYLVAQKLTAGVMRPSPEDPLPRFIVEKTAEDRLRVFRVSRVQMQPSYSFDTWTIALALLFEGLLPHVGNPSSFEDMVRRLRTALQLFSSVKRADLCKASSHGVSSGTS
ncbi:hypothetical protein E8E11_010548 [Didymella keratinophila]|uniref:Uncharacterized protein n=1 Tax=Didymella heteroderae TaxID=1769908 RepID=A0A9P4WFS2_9PLEO|nr:hypothetical protein E8E12_000594 [Didymella heteroderae]KAF3050392.1 hypothetical protein E8E11_010548 [Didymella keratinophila]